MTKKASAQRDEILFEGDEDKHREEPVEPFCPLVVHYLGLCLTCNHALGCTFTRRSDSPVLYCEEFDISDTLHQRLTRDLAVQPPNRLQNPFEGLLGLCSNCEKRGTCTLPKAEGGVWHCEEYI